MSDNEYEDIPIAAEPDHDDSASQSAERPTPQESSLSAANAGARSQSKLKKRGSRRGSMRSASGVSFADMDEATRERTHLAESNEKLRVQIRTLKGQLKTLREQRDGPISTNEKKEIARLKEQNAKMDEELEGLRAKAAMANDVELLDDLTDELQEKTIQLKTLELQRRNLADNGRHHAKLLNHNDAMPSRQKVFLDLKEERRHHKKRMRTLKETYDRTVNYIKEVEKRAEEAEATLQERGIADVTHTHVKDLQSKDKAQKKQLDSLRKQMAILSGTFQAQMTQTQWIAKDKETELDRLKEEVKFIEAQILNKEKLIMSNNNISERPPHYLQPMGDEIPPAPPTPKEKKKIAKPAIPKVKPQPPASTNNNGRPQPKEKPAAAPPKKKAVPPSQKAKAKAKKEDEARAKKAQQDEDEAQLPSPRKPTPPEAAAPPKEEASPRKASPSPVESENDRLNDLDSPKRSPTPPSEHHSPTPPQRSPTPPSEHRSPTPPDYATDDFNEESPKKEYGDVGPSDDVQDDDGAAGYASDDFEAESPRKKDEDDVADDVVDDDDGYGDDTFDDDKKDDDAEPAFLTD